MLRRDAKVELLKRVPLFAHCSKGELGQVARVADEIDMREGRVLTSQGERGREFFVLVEGLAEVRRGGRKINTMNAGDFFGDIALFGDRPRSAGAVAVEPTVLLTLRPAHFQQMIVQDPAMACEIFRALCTRIRRFDETMQAVAG